MRALLEALGRQARWALPMGVFAGIVLPGLAALARPLLTAAVIGTLLTTLLRMDWERLRRAILSPRLAVLLTLWQLVATPALIAALGTLIGLPPALLLILLLQGAAPPIGSAAAFAMIVGIDGALSLVVTVLATLFLPITLTTLVALLPAGTGVEVDIFGFFTRVSLLVAMPFALALVLRQLVGVSRLVANASLLTGLNVILLVIFAVAVMDGVTARLLAEPAYIGRLLLIACVMALLLHAVPWWVLRRLGSEVSLNAALVSGNRNMGLMLAVTAGTAGEAFSLYVGIAQIPMYFAPLLLAPLARIGPRRGASP